MMNKHSVDLLRKLRESAGKEHRVLLSLLEDRGVSSLLGDMPIKGKSAAPRVEKHGETGRTSALSKITSTSGLMSIVGKQLSAYGVVKPAEVKISLAEFAKERSKSTFVYPNGLVHDEQNEIQHEQQPGKERTTRERDGGGIYISKTKARHGIE